MSEKVALSGGAVLAALLFLIGILFVVNNKPAEEVVNEATIHVFTHTVDDREVRCIHFSEYGLSCDWTYGDREGINP